MSFKTLGKPIKPTWVQTGRCYLCGKRASFGHSPYCPRCSKFCARLKDSGIRGKALEAIHLYVRRYGFVCYYTGMLLDLDDPESPWYCVFDHWKPRDGRKVVLTSNLFNEMKSDLTEGELWYYILQLYNYKKYHTKIKKRPVVFWQRLTPKAPTQFLVKISRKCCICGKPVHSPSAQYCPRCAKFGLRMRTKEFTLRTVEAIWDYIRKYGYVCYYTGMSLDLDDPNSPWYCVFDHWRPGDGRKVVITSNLFTEMKSDLTENEFWYFIGQLARYRLTGAKVKKMKITHWNR